MLDKEQREYVRKATMTMQIITGALACGVLVFAIVVFFITTAEEEPAAEDHPFITYLALGFSALAIIAALVVPSLITANIRKSLLRGASFPGNAAFPKQLGEVGSLLAAYQTKLIVGAALLEGAAFFNLVTYLLEGQAISLIMAGLLLMGILLKLPSRSGVESWIAEQARTLKEMRELRG